MVHFSDQPPLLNTKAGPSTNPGDIRPFESPDRLHQSSTCAQGSHRHRHGHVAFEKMVRAEQKPDKVPERDGVDDVLALVRSEAKVYADARRQKKEREEKMLADYYRRAETRAQQILEVSNTLKSMRPCEWMSAEHTCDALVCCQQAKACVAELPEHSVIQELAEAWDKRHWSVPAHAPMQDSHWKSTRCYKAGTCICRGQHLPARHMISRLTRWLRREFPKSAGDQLSQGQILLMFRGVREDNSLEELRVYFVALHYWSPIRPTLLEVHHISLAVPASPLVDEEAACYRALSRGAWVAEHKVVPRYLNFGEPHVPPRLAPGTLEEHRSPSCPSPRCSWRLWPLLFVGLGA